MRQLDVIIGWIQGRIKKNKNVIIVINGATGSGKTYSGISIAQEAAKHLGTNFSAGQNIAFSFKDMLRNMQLEENAKPGTAFVFEEVGAFGGGASSREWQSKANKFFFSFLQTSRHRNQILIMTCPYFSFLDAGARALVHLQCDTAAIDYKKRLTYIKPRILQVNSRTGKIYFKYIRFSVNKKPYTLPVAGIPCPDSETLALYEKMKLNYTSNLYQSMLDDNPEAKPLRKHYINEVQLQDYVNKGYSNKQISDLFKVAEDSVRRAIHRLGIVKQEAFSIQNEQNA